MQLADFTDSLEKIVLGAERRIVLSPDERERTAYHESGHALLGMLQPGADPVRKISIIPRGRALGVTFQSPDDRPVRLLRRLPEGAAGRLAGRARRRAPDLRRPDDRRRVRPRAGHAHRPRDGRAVGHVRRRRAGLRAAGPERRADALPRGRRSRRSARASWSTARPAGSSRSAPTRRWSQLKEHREQLEALTRALLEHETLDEADAYRIAGVDRVPPAPLPA